MPRGAKQAKGLLLSCIEEPDPCIMFEPKILYRTAIDDVPTAHYKIEIGKAEIVREGRNTGRTDRDRLLLWISFTSRLRNNVARGSHVLVQRKSLFLSHTSEVEIDRRSIKIVMELSRGI